MNALQRRVALNRVHELVDDAMQDAGLVPDDKLELATIMIITWLTFVRAPVEGVLTDLCENIRRNYNMIVAKYPDNPS